MSGYAPYGQLVKMLLPSAGSIALYDAGDELLWCSDGYERPDLRGLLENLRLADTETLAGPGSVKSTSAGVPAFVAGLHGDRGRALGSLVLELPQGQNARYSGSMVASLLRPVLDCLASRLDLEQTVVAAEHDSNNGLDLLLSVDENDRDDATALEQLLSHCVEHLGCALGALLVPDKSLAVTVSADPSGHGSQLLDRTQKHLLAWAQLNNRPMVVNRVAGSSEAAPLKILSCPVRDPYQRVTGLIAVFRSAGAEDFELRDVRILEFVSRKAIAILGSQYDDLTGLPNRLIFDRRMQAGLDRAEAGAALLYVDVDKLLTVNETFGFHAGDEVIRRVAEVVKAALGPDDQASRIAGDRFAIFLPGRNVHQATELGKRILADAAQLGYADGSQAVPVTVSVGVAAVDGGRGRAPHLLASAEVACKRAKQQGRNRLELHSDDNTQMLVRRKELLAATSLQDALRTNDFRLEAQPIVGLFRRPGETMGHEVFVRMRSANGELLAPDKFIEAAERYELMPALDRWVLACAIDILREHDALPAGACFTINVSAQSVASRKFASFALEHIGVAGLPPALFCFEINEAAAVQYLAQAEACVRELTAAGCTIALDDFGCGLSALAHLKRLPVQYLKIDGRLVRRVLEDRVAESIVSGITRAAKTLGIATIAEHVESAALADKLRELEADFGQGFHLGRAAPFARVARTASQRAPSVRAAL